MEIFPIPNNEENKKTNMKIYSKETLIDALKVIREMGWIKNARPGNAGGVGNTLEDLLGIDENNLPIPNAAEWELKAQRAKSSSLTTGLHTEPSPTVFRFVPKILLPKYGWPHKLAGIKYPANELSFRQTINCSNRTDRGFGITVNREKRKIEVSFDFTKVGERHKEWLESVRVRAGLGELSPQPYWGFDDLFHVVGAKLTNCFYVKAQSKKIEGDEYFWYNEIMVLRQFNQDKFIDAIENGYALIDFDARTHHNHGTKFRLRQDILSSFYTDVTRI
jgi:hypothetical protein